MTTPCSGMIGVSHINTELQTVGSPRTLGQSDGRALCGVVSGSISLSDYYCRSTSLQAVGGVESSYTDVNGHTWKVHTFWSTGNFQVISTGSNPSVEYLIISSGAGGGQQVSPSPRGAGGGGGSGTYNIGVFSVSVGLYIASVGLGGGNNANGSASSIFGVSVPGGGRGGRYLDVPGGDGASGGGGGQGWASFGGVTYTNGGAPTYSPGHSGGRSAMGNQNTNAAGGGGGGAGGPGQDSQPVSYALGTVYSTGGPGGVGVVVQFAGSDHPVGGGGGGGGVNSTTNGAGGTTLSAVAPGGPGGPGGLCGPYPSGGRGTDFPANNGSQGVDGTGGGGGGGSFEVPGYRGGHGKIVLRYRI